MILTPVLKAYKEQTNEEIYLAHLERLPVNDVLAECPYISGFHTIPDVWNDFPNVDVGRAEVMKQADEICKKHDYHLMAEVTLSPTLGKTHKLFRACLELGIVEIDDLTTEVFPTITDEVREQADKFLETLVEPYTFVHRVTGNSPKDLEISLVYQLLQGTPAISIIEYGSNDLLGATLPLGNIPLDLEILSRCESVLCADSFIMHAACAMGIPTKAVFTHTPPAWVVPLHDVPLEILMRV